MKIFFSLIFIISSIINSVHINSNIKSKFLDWGLKNNLNITSYVEVTLNEKKDIKFIAKEDIPKKKDLIIIPKSMLFNVIKAIELIGSKTLKKQYNEFSKLNLTYEPNPYDFRKEESFIAYIFYLIEHRPKKYQKTKFYEIYEHYLNSLQKFTVRTPIFYETYQMEYLGSTSLAKATDVIKNTFQNEIDIFSNKSYFKRDLDFEEYVNYRLQINNKGLNVSNRWTMIPFFNNLDTDYTLYNANYSIEENGDIRIFSKKKIKKGDEIILDSPKKSNIRRLLLEGKTNEKLYKYFPEYIIPAFSPGLYYKYKLTDESLRKYYYNLKDKDFESKATSIYLDHVDVLDGDGSDTWAYTILALNLKYYKEYFERMNLSEIYEVFYDKDDRINIERIIRGEKRVIDRAIDKISETIDQFVEIQEKYLKKDDKQDKAKKEKKDKKEKKKKKKNEDL